ncbi:zinc-ribbon domain-containing protein [Leifsonia sp. 21MFCrub1.1]|uniref:zinc-ribbon domain-containing protein n=1 Tax=Leifsonia sp. 21MFCrub1.1 TaxID=1798223 RepID=UPI00089281A3|nr:zinc-ribbon domain-containing protein [Leifsonia sp. 21MFCrub1.1]SEA82199.1 Probable Zinc-ribbon domain-containing protein [Leifsonia sp. 21MFCrub1.1]
MPESVEQWWARRQWSKGVAVPYEVGRYRTDWERYPVLVRQYHPDLNHGITLTQVPPAADVYLVWECDSGHRFVATPEEQRGRPGGTRRRSAWCPRCAEAAVAKPVRAAEPDAGLHPCGHARDLRRIENDPQDDRCYLCRRLDREALTREQLVSMAAPGSRVAVSNANSTAGTYAWQCTAGHPSYQTSIERILGGRRCPICRHARAGADAVPVGEAFVSRWAPAPASAAEPELKRRLGERLDIDLSPNAVRVAKPFHSHLEVWPDILLPELRVAIEYDTTGRHGLEHVGPREASDRRKDRLLRAAGWEVVRVRCGALRPIGPYDVHAGGITDALVERIVTRLGEIRGDLFVAAYLR